MTWANVHCRAMTIIEDTIICSNRGNVLHNTVFYSARFYDCTFFSFTDHYTFDLLFVPLLFLLRWYVYLSAMKYVYTYISVLTLWFSAFFRFSSFLARFFLWFNHFFLCFLNINFWTFLILCFAVGIGSWLGALRFATTFFHFIPLSLIVLIEVKTAHAKIT